MLEIVVGSLSLFLGWLCFDYMSRVRALFSTKHTLHSRFYGEKPPMIFPSVLGVLFVLDALALLAVAAFERLHVADGLKNSVGLEVILIVVLVSITTVALVRIARGSRRNKQKVERQQVTA